MNEDDFPVKFSLKEFQDAMLQKLAEDGTRIGLCPNCGTHYPIGPEDSETVCSERCHNAYLKYLNEES